MADDSCIEADTGVCDWVLSRTDSTSLALGAEGFVNSTIRIVLIVVVGYVLSWLIRRIIVRQGKRLVKMRYRRGWAGKNSAAEEEREKQRVDTSARVIVSLVRFLVGLIVILVVLGELGFSLAPLLAGAGVLGVALGFGAQKVVADFLAGFFMLVEGQFGVGDVIDVGEVSGTVEDLSLRMVTLRDVHGTVWFVSNSEIRRVANKSQLWSRAVLDIEVAYDTDLRRAEGVIQRVADDLWQDDNFTEGDIIEAPEVWGVEDLGANGVSIRLVVKTDPAEQWVVARELRLRLKEAFDEAKIEMPYPQRTIWVRSGDTVPVGSRPQVKTAPPRHGTGD